MCRHVGWVCAHVSMCRCAQCVYAYVDVCSHVSVGAHMSVCRVCVHTCEWVLTRVCAGVQGVCLHRVVPTGNGRCWISSPWTSEQQPERAMRLHSSHRTCPRGGRTQSFHRSCPRRQARRRATRAAGASAEPPSGAGVQAVTSEPDQAASRPSGARGAAMLLAALCPP